MLSDYLLHLADNALILGHRNSEWTGHGPVLEQDIALSNIALDLIGQSRNLYQLAADQINARFPEKKSITEDDLAYLRDASEFRNVLLQEQPCGDWGLTILRQFYYSQFQLLQSEALLQSTDGGLAAISEKSLKEIRYHLKWSSEWVCRLGDGTAESRDRMLKAIEHLKPLLPEFFAPANFELEGAAAGWAVNPATLQEDWIGKVNRVLETATLPVYEPENDIHPVASGKTGFHSRHLDQLLSEMQYLQRTYPGCSW